MSNIRQVAALANVSIATVSRVINADTTYKMTSETRERVWKAIAQLDYKPPVYQHRSSVASRSVAFQKIGCIINAREGKYSDPYYNSILSGIENYLRANHAEIYFVRTRKELEDSETLIHTFSTSLDGLILMVRLGEPILSYIRSKVPHIVGIDSKSYENDNIEYDHELASHMAVRYLVNNGYREIGFIGGPEEDQAMCQCRRYRAYANAMEDHSLKIHKQWVLDCEWNASICSRQVEALGKDGLPRSFFASSDLMAMATLRTLSIMRVSVPDEVAVIGLTGIDMSKYSNPPLTTIRIPAEALGEAAAQTLINRINGDVSLPRRILFPLTYIIRESA